MLFIEFGVGVFSEYYYWLGEMLKDSMWVVCYDWVGIGYSDLSDVFRDLEIIVGELYIFLEKVGELLFYILVGYLYGGYYICVFIVFYLEEVVGLVFIDVFYLNLSERLNMLFELKFLKVLYKVGVIIGDLGVLGLGDRVLGLIFRVFGLLEEVMNCYFDYMLNGKYLWGYFEEEKGYLELVERFGGINDFGFRLIRVFVGINLNEKVFLKMGLNLEEIRIERRKM